MYTKMYKLAHAYPVSGLILSWNFTSSGPLKKSLIRLKYHKSTNLSEICRKNHKNVQPGDRLSFKSSCNRSARRFSCCNWRRRSLVCWVCFRSEARNCSDRSLASCETSTEFNTDFGSNFPVFLIFTVKSGVHIHLFSLDNLLFHQFGFIFQCTDFRLKFLNFMTFNKVYKNQKNCKLTSSIASRASCSSFSCSKNWLFNVSTFSSCWTCVSSNFILDSSSSWSSWRTWPCWTSRAFFRSSTWVEASSVEVRLSYKRFNRY